MTRLILLALLFFLGYTLYTALIRFLKGGKPSPPPKTLQGEEMVKDPSCGTFLPKGEAIRKTVAGRTYYFCSERCQREFEARDR